MSILGSLSLSRPLLRSHCSCRVIPCEHPESWADRAAPCLTMWSTRANQSTRPRGLQSSSGRQSTEASWRRDGGGCSELRESKQMKRESTRKVKESYELRFASHCNRALILQINEEMHCRGSVWQRRSVSLTRRVSHDYSCLSRQTRNVATRPGNMSRQTQKSTRAAKRSHLQTDHTLTHSFK